MSHSRFALLGLIVLVGFTLGAANVAADDAPGGGGGISMDVSADGGAKAAAGTRPTHRSFNLHLGVGAAFALGDALADHDPSFKENGGEGTIGLDIVMIEPLAFSVLGGFDGFGIVDTDGLRSVFVGAGLRLRLFADQNGPLFDDGTAAGNLWIDAHLAYYNYNYEDHGGYNIGLGYEFALWRDVNLGPYVRLHHTPWGDGLNFAMLSVGVAISFGGQLAPDDRDGDGIPDDIDKCPDDPEDFDGFEDEDGCPDPDNDQDGVCDPWVARQGLLGKYADICKGSDRCPDEPGPLENDGCPVEDRDGDGVPDDEDECPDVPGPAHNKGCPVGDRDGDGVPDDVDLCPDVPGPGSKDGCPSPDRDNDGLCDPWVFEHGMQERYADVCKGVDACPDEPGPGTEDGCPRMVRVVGDQIKILQKVFFATNKATILEESFPVLDEVAQVIVYKQDIKVRVEGHTDNKGNAKKNLKLSQDRAESVKAYLVSKGVTEDRLVAEGKGQEVSIADNKTEEGRGENRRVEFHIIPPATAADEPATEE